MAKEINELLIEMSKDIKSLRESQEELKIDIRDLKSGQSRLEQKVDTIQNNQELFEKAVMEQFKKIDGKFDKVQDITKDNLYDITLLKKQARWN